jgi:hypothetical protein
MVELEHTTQQHEGFDHNAWCLSTVYVGIHVNWIHTSVLELVYIKYTQILSMAQIFLYELI